MKRLLLLSLLLLHVVQLSAQAPHQFSFQGVARDAAGKTIANTAVSIRLTIHEGSPGGANVYQETHKPQTSNGGIFTVSVGAGSNQMNTFANIKWSAGSYFLQVEMDAAGGSNYIDLGATQLLSVPYALHAGQADKWKDGDPVVQTGKDNQGGVLQAISKNTNNMIWYPRKGAFRAGYVGAGEDWDESAMGYQSVAFGVNTRAKGDISSAFGIDTKAVGAASFAAGYNTVAKGEGSFVVGLNNDITDIPNTGQMRIFQIGAGSVIDNIRANAMTVLGNGNVGIGKNVVEPKYILDIGARPRIRHNPASPNGTTAGIFFDDSNGSPEGFVGMKTNTEIGFYHTDKWTFWIDNQGSAHVINGVLTTSDRRLKRNFASLSNSLPKLTDLNGYHYFWKDSTLDQTLQTGLIAQEVETHFPELVKTDDKGFKSVNYTGLIPHLIESVKELDKKYQQVTAENDALKTALKRLEKLETAINRLTSNSVLETSSK
ncbi:tail fiber domain-containing protein [Dyadobacter sp. CY323]|uniref:tail fiber domain-containing protein n=1 Tax=Dyadobacter sp. CY323 TaxID=2907302 RepID=UPI001F256274|nr:tail fiber domain-containing protein [Dyadobacter sp. CY323]MCE6987769.1 tail fiber domain-containing protein [Dyadobacter sp. CY323]